jgi:hypothetical protein
VNMPLPANLRPAAPASPARRSNWGLRLVALLLSALAFLGFWQGARHASSSSQSSGDYAPPSGTQGVLLPPGGLGTHGSTRLS